jgi:hypothetical protein
MKYKERLARISGVVAIAFFLAVLGSGFSLPFSGESGVSVAIAGGPMVSVSPLPVKPKKGKVSIAGSGFKPNQAIGIRIFMGGVLSDISYLVKPKVEKTNEFGAFGATWGLNREFKRKLLKAGTTYEIAVVDEDGNTLATAPFMVDKAAKKKGKKKKKK